MKILHIIPNLTIGGAERLVVDICEEIYSTKEHEIKLITFNNSFHNFEKPPSYFTHIPSCFHPSITSKSMIKVEALQNFIDNYNPDIIHSHLWETEMLLSKIEIKNAIRFTHFHDNISQLRNSILVKTKKDVT